MPFSPGTLHLGEVHVQLLSLLLGGLGGVRLLLASAALVFAFSLLASFFLLFISATAAGEPAGQTAHGVRGLLGRSSSDLRRLSRNLSYLVGHLPDLIRDSIQRSSAVLAFGLLVVHNYSFLSMASPGSLLLVRSAYDVPNGDAASGAGSLNLVEINAELLGLLLSGLRSVRLLFTTGCLLRGLLALLSYLLPLLGGLSGRILSLACGLTCGVLGLLGGLPRLVCHLTGRILRLARGLSGRILRLARNLLGLIRGLARRLLSLACRLSGRILHALGDLPYLVCHPTERATAALLLIIVLLLATGESTGQAANRVLGLARNLSDLVGSLASHLLGLVCGLARYLARLVGGLASHLLGLTRHLPRRVLSLLPRALRKLHYLLLGALCRLVHLVLDALLLGRLVNGPFELHVVVGHFLDLGLRVALR
jgi:hypothetical protein